MKAFTYERVDTPLAAAKAAQQPNAKFIAGGTNLLDLMKLQIETPAHLIDVNRLGLDKIEQLQGGGLRIGALVRNSELAADPVVRKSYPLLSQALLAGASGQLRNKATTGGNLLQRTRCYYFYDITKPCNKREPGSGCSALEGFNRIHAVLGTSESCIATHPSDMAIAMRALDAVVQTTSADGSARSIPIADFHLLPGDSPHIETALHPGEFITSVDLPAPVGGKQIYRKVRDRASYAFALISVAAIVKSKNGILESAQVAFGGVAHKPWRDVDAERRIVETPAHDTAFKDFGEQVFANARGFGSNDFKIVLGKRTVAAVLRSAVEV